MKVAKWNRMKIITQVIYHTIQVLKDDDDDDGGGGGDDDNTNNYKTSIAPISSKRIELNDSPSTGVGQTHSPGTM